MLREREIASSLVGDAAVTPAHNLKCITKARCEDPYRHNVGVRAQNLIHDKRMSNSVSEQLRIKFPNQNRKKKNFSANDGGVAEEEDF